ncbi:division inhibitor protein [Devosia equisanguinis]|uniref:Division inhibitor protein n=1 Tax=Devosia equisanguinis TaxID=2490941 RepID=A0A3S4CBN9_9HYPH|nr:TetR/AcrR family transcriptional regulator [Devosia equisanguinis]VDS03512.1 division inhibitor protein [Devosia equisanguinis]
MARPALTDAEERAMRSTILLQAARIIAARGYSALSMRTLALEVGLSPGALYRYFASKQEVLAAHASEAVEDMTARLQSIASASLPPVQTARAMLLEYCRFCAEDPDRFRVLFSHEAEEAARCSTRSPAPSVEEAFALAERQVQLCLDSGDFEAPSARAATLVLWACAHGLVSLWSTITEIEIGDSQAFFEMGISTVLRGLRSESINT